MVSKDKSKTWIFSDGSVAGPTRNIVDGGFVISKPDRFNTKENITRHIISEHSIQLPSGSIALAEITSMLQAFKHVLESTNIDTDSITAFCDNKTVVNIANNLQLAKGDLSKSALELQQILFKLRQNTTVKICWIPAHCNIHLHDRADHLATNAHKGIKLTGQPGKVNVSLP